MVNSMLSNVKLTLKSTIPISYGTGDTFTVFETGIVAEAASVVFSNKTQLERFQVDIADTGVCTILLRGLDNTEVKTEVAGLKKAWDVGANGYITILASDIFDKDATSPQRLKAPFIFEDDIIIEKDLKVEGNMKVEGDFEVDGPTKPFPEVDDEIARDILYPNPTGGEIAIVGGYIQIYNADTAQWETLDVGTPLPDATETVKGKIRIATEEEALAGSNDTVAMTPKKVKELTTTEIEANEASLTDATFMLGEPCTKGDSLFKEVGPTFAQATTAQNIGDVAGNTRVSIPVIGSGVAGNSLKLALAKVDDLGKDLTLRIETDNAGEPSGDLVDANAIATIARTDLTTSLTDEDITLADTITIGEGTKAHIVLAQEGDEVDSARYFKVGCLANNTTTRPFNVFDGTDWSTADNDKFGYVSSDLFVNTLLSKTDARYTYKLPNDIPRFAKSNGVIGEKVKCSYLGIADLFSSLDIFRPYFLSDMPGAIGLVKGTNVYMCGYTLNDGKLMIGFNQYLEAGDTTTLVTLPTVRSTQSTTYVTLKSATIVNLQNISYNMRISFSQVAPSYGIGTSGVFVNGVLIQERSLEMTYSNKTRTVDIYLKNGDLVEIKSKHNTGNSSAAVANFVITYTTTISQTLVAPTVMNTVD